MVGQLDYRETGNFCGCESVVFSSSVNFRDCNMQWPFSRLTFLICIPMGGESGMFVRQFRAI